MIDIAKTLKGQSGPASEVKPNEFVMMLMQDHPSEVLPFPRNGPDGKPLFEYRMSVLTQRELDGCLIDAERYTMAQFKGSKVPSSEELGSVRGDAWTEVFSNAKIVEVLQRACRQITPKTGPTGKVYYDPLFLGGEQIRQLLTTDELVALFHAYQNTQFKFGPLWKILSEKEVEDILEKISKGADNLPFSHLEPGSLLILVASLAAQLLELRTGSGSCGSGCEKPISESLKSNKLEE